VQFIDGSAFESTKLNSISIEARNDIFDIEHEFLIDIAHHKLIRNFSISSDIEIPRTIAILGSSCFSRCEALSSISFESNSGLKQIEARALNATSVHSVVIPSTVCFIASNAFDPECRLSLLDGSSCPEFERWSAVRGLDSNIDFRRIQKLCSGLRRFSDCVIDLSGFEGGDAMGVSGTGSAHLYRRCDDGLELVVKLFAEFDQDESCEIEKEIEKLMNVTHPCIAAPFAFILPAASKELRIARLYTRGGSLNDVLSTRPLWWTPTAKAIAVAGIVLGMKFLHSFGLIHGGLKPNNVLFDEYHQIKIADFGRNRLDLRKSAASVRGVASEFEAPEMLSGEERTAKIDIFSFALILFKIVVGLSALGETSTSEQLGKLPVNACERAEIPVFVPTFVSVLIQSGLSANPRERPSFNDISEVMKENCFRIADGVDSDEVSAFVSLIESSET
jgi:serine/threonine protein kinase